VLAGPGCAGVPAASSDLGWLLKRLVLPDALLLLDLLLVLLAPNPFLLLASLLLLLPALSAALLLFDLRLDAAAAVTGSCGYAGSCVAAKLCRPDGATAEWRRQADCSTGLPRSALHSRGDDEDEDVQLAAVLEVVVGRREVGCAALQRGKRRKPRLSRPGLRLPVVWCVGMPRVDVPAGSSSSRCGSCESKPQVAGQVLQCCTKHCTPSS
jgi:hypothetical protein